MRFSLKAKNPHSYTNSRRAPDPRRVVVCRWLKCPTNTRCMVIFVFFCHSRFYFVHENRRGRWYSLPIDTLMQVLLMKVSKTFEPSTCDLAFRCAASPSPTFRVVCIVLILGSMPCIFSSMTCSVSNESFIMTRSDKYYQESFQNLQGTVCEFP